MTTALTFEDFFAEYEPVIHGICYEYGAKGHRWGADHDDFRQEALLWMHKNLKKMNAKRAEIEDPDAFGRWLARVLRNNSADYVVDIKAQAGGQDRATAYWYSIAELKVLLDSMFDPEKWLDPPQYENDRRSKSNPAHGGNWMTTLADVSRGYSKLKKEDRDLLSLFHHPDMKMRNKDLAGAYEITESQMSWRHGRAVERLLEHLGGPKPEQMRPDVPGDPFRGRRAVSNAHARAMTSSNYDGDE